MIGWYKIAKDLSKIAQIWLYEPENDDIGEYNKERTFGSKIKEMYELEYKWSMVKTKPFFGLPQRQENILKQLEKHLIDVTVEIQKQLIYTIGTWLKTHALTNRFEWANSRIEQDLDSGVSLSEFFGVMTSEYMKYSPYYNHNELSTVKRMVGVALKNPSDYPAFISFVESSYVEPIKQEQELMKEAQIYDATDNLENFNMYNQQTFKTVEEAIDWINSNSCNDEIDIDDILYDDMSDLDSFVYQLEEAGVGDAVLREFYANQVFPLWMAYWKEKGLIETRKNVETVYNLLVSATPNDIGGLVAAVNFGLHVNHQTGAMLSYLEEDIERNGDKGSDDLKYILDQMAEGSFIERANKQLREVGVKI